MQLAQSLDHEDSTVNYNMACLFALIVDQDSALDCLEHSLLAEQAGLKSWVENDSDLESLRGHPRFTALVEAME